MAKIYNANKSYTLLSGTSDGDDIENGGADKKGKWHNGGYYVTIDGGAGDDYIYSEQDNSSLVGGAGNDKIWTDGRKATITGGEGNDSIVSWGSKATITGGAGNDTIYNGLNGVNSTIKGGAGNDKIWNNGSKAKIYGGAGNDSIESHGYYVTITGGAGNDTIYNNCYRQSDGSIFYYTDSRGSNVRFQYNAGDGNDIIYGFKKNSTLSVGGGSYSTTKSGSNIIVTVGTGAVTLVGAANLSKVNIKGTKKTAETNSWRVSGTTATYGTSSKTLIKITGVKSGTSTSNISLSGKTVTLKAAALSTNKVTISDGYKLALASDVTKSVTTNKKWSLSGSTATYKSGGTTAGYKLSSDAKSISYQSASGGSTLATITGLKSGTSVNNISTSGNTVTLKAAALSTSKVTISGDYKLALADDVQKSKPTSAKWTKSNGIAKYISAKTSAGYKLASDSKSISYISGSGGQQIIKITGLKNNASTAGISLSNKIVTVAANAVADGKTVSVTGAGYKFKLNGTSGKNTLQGGAGNDTLTGNGGADTFIYTGGKDIITDYTAQDKIKISTSYTDTISGNDVILTTNKGTLTIKNSANKNITINGDIKNFSDDDNDLPTGLSYSDDKTVLIVGNNFTVGTIDLSKYADVIDVDASNYRRMNLKITGNDFNNSLVGGLGSDTIFGSSGDDTLTGGTLLNGDGIDIFEYSGGNDTIIDYTAGEDKIKFNRKIIDWEIGRNDVTFITSKGTLKVLNGAGKDITIIDSSGKEITQKYSANISEILADNLVGEFEIENKITEQENLITFAK